MSIAIDLTPARAAGSFYLRIGGAIVGFYTVLAVIGSIIAPYGANDQDLLSALDPPSLAHLFGTDALGRDMLSRVIIGTRFTLTATLVSVAAALIAGVALGIAAGYLEGRIAAAIAGFIDLLLTIPSLVLVIAIASVIGAGLFGLILAISITFVPPMARLVRGRVLELKSEDYVEAARAIGTSDLGIMRRHILPNAFTVIVVEASLAAGQAVLIAAALGFLGLGVQPPAPEWGTMLGAGREYMQRAPYLVLCPGIAISLLILGFNLLGDGLRDRFDPRTG
ncbi:MAG TPA: ABC transporter permease [Stellaceae bacterium]|nr:ABC transporter permease [Stellaceae bacterium]